MRNHGQSSNVDRQNTPQISELARVLFLGTDKSIFFLQQVFVQE
jgi:hypothetical protein